MPDSTTIPAPFWHDLSVRDSAARRAELRIFGWTMAGVVGLLAILYNRWWIPFGDSDFYLVCARNIASGRHYTFNGMRVAMEPPGWPFILAGAMKLSSSFAFLKCLNPAVMTVFLGLSFWIVRRFVPGARTAAAIVLGTALLSNVYELSYCFHSDPLFCAISAAEFLLALQIREGRSGGWRIGLLLLLCAGSVFIRWAGPFNWPIIAGILVSGMRRPERNRLTLTAVASFVVICLTFLILFNAIKLTKAEQEAAKKSGLFVDESSRSESQSYNLLSGVRFKGSATPNWELRLQSIGHWLSWFFYEPLRMAGLRANVVSVPLGWLGIVLLGIQVWLAIKRAEWLWVGLAAPCATLFGFWPNVTARYLLPFFPFLLLAMLGPVVWAIGQKQMPWLRSVARRALAYFVVTCVLCNAGLYGIEAWVFRHRDFYSAYYGGIQKSLIAAGHRLTVLDAGNDQIAVSPRYENLGRPHSTRFGMRGLAVLTNRNILLIPYELTMESVRPPPAQNLLDWLKQRHIKYYVCETPISPWRWHFSMAWLQRKMEKKAVLELPSTWEVWDISGAKPQRIDLPPVEDWPTHVPGM